MLRAVAAAIVSAVGLLSLPSPAGAAEPVYVIQPCPADWQTGTRTVECGTLTVDETRGDPATRRIDIAVATIRATAPFRDASGRALPPVLVFHGGPGGSLTPNVGRIAARWSADPERAGPLAAVDQDFIFFDQRGGGRSDPSMDCPGVELTDAGPPSAEDQAGLTACLQAYADPDSVDGRVNLSQYNAAVIAADVADMRKAMKLERIDLYGGSYGPRIEAAVITHAPEGVRAVVMDSPWPPEGNWAVNTPQQVSNAVRLILSKCAAQTECGARHPDLQARFEANAREWLAGPKTGADGRVWTVEDLAAFLMETTYDGDGVRRLPHDLEAIVSGDFSPIADVATNRDYYFEGQHMTHLCKEELPFESKDRLAAGAAGDPVAEVSVPSLSRLFDVCAAIDVGPADPAENEPVHTDIPTLFVAAEIDPGCPPEFTRAAAAGYTHSQVMIVVNATHGVIGDSPCAARAARDFLRDPTKPVDQTCLPPADEPLAFAE